ncbi:hypothetical protein ISG33_14495 [Glaciecola sp. MH2013]|uniref:hypothetical protein n=1 Tax=Glaciecola sp. MH2013 TaxID=2785524 RepID=UPI00189E93BB|nr:hypothetical protein [Glaciecola sp. MH2013]MBF7074612.1 hypothetical protein [Glaciecola sp. MH2013]
MRIEKSTLTGKYKKLYFCVSRILYDNDIEGINFGVNDDEYEPEVGTILPRLHDASSVEDIQLILSEEFNHWFGSNRELDEYYDSAKEIWAAWLSYKSGIS